MNPAKGLRRECDEILARTGQYIAPTRLTTLMSADQKVTKTILEAGYCISYHEATLVLQIVLGAIRGATMKGDEMDEKYQR